MIKNTVKSYVKYQKYNNSEKVLLVHEGNLLVCGEINFCLQKSIF